MKDLHIIDWKIIDNCLEADWSGDPYMNMYQEQISGRCRRLKDDSYEWLYWEYRFENMVNYVNFGDYGNIV